MLYILLYCITLWAKKIERGCDSLPIASSALEGDIVVLLRDCTPQELKIMGDILSVTRKTLKENK